MQPLCVVLTHNPLTSLYIITIIIITNSIEPIIILLQPAVLHDANISISTTTVRSKSEHNPSRTITYSSHSTVFPIAQRTSKHVNIYIYITRSPYSRELWSFAKWVRAGLIPAAPSSQTSAFTSTISFPLLFALTNYYNYNYNTYCYCTS